MRILLGCLLFVVSSIVVVVAMTIFGIGAVNRMEEVAEQAALHNIAPAETGPPFLQLLWATDTEGDVQALAGLPGGELLAFRATGGIYRFGLSGQILEEEDWPEKVYLAHGDQTGRFAGVLVSSAVTVWRWSFQGYEALRQDLAAYSTTGEELWRFSQGPDEASRIDPFLGDFDGDGEVEIACPLKTGIALLDKQGQLTRTLTRRAVSQRFDLGDFDQNGSDELIWCDTRGDCTILNPIDGSSTQIQAGGAVGSIRAAPHATPPAILFKGRDYQRENMPEVVRVLTLDGSVLFQDEYSSTVHGAPRSALWRADFDGDGSEAWVIQEGDGSIRLYAHDGSKSGVHYTGLRIKDLITIRRPGGDVLAAATHRGVAVWGRSPNPDFVID